VQSKLTTGPADSDDRTLWRRTGQEPSHIRKPTIDFLLLHISRKAALDRTVHESPKYSIKGGARIVSIPWWEADRPESTALPEV